MMQLSRPEPPPYYEDQAVQRTGESQPLLQNRRRRSFDSSNDSLGDLELQSQSPCAATFWAMAAGISWSGCRILLQNIQLNVIEVDLVGGLVQVSVFSCQNKFLTIDVSQIVLSGLFVTLCQCHRLWPVSPPARNSHKLFLVLYVSYTYTFNIQWHHHQ